MAGSWDRRIYEALTTSAENLDYVTQDNFTETLANPSSTRLYVVTGRIDVGSTTITIPSGGLNLVGYTFDLSGLYSSVSNFTMFDGDSSGNVLMTDLYLEVTGSGSKVFDITSNTGFDAAEFNRVNFNDCVSLGTITNYRQGLESGTGRFGGTPELTLAGTWVGGYFIETSIVRSLTDGAYSLYKAGAGFSMASRFRSNQNIDLPASASFFDFTDSNFTNPSTVQLTGSIISRAGVFNSLDSNITPNLTASDVVCAWDSNIGVPNTFEGGEQSITSESTTTVSTSGDEYDISGTWTASNLQHFESVGVGGLKHLGTDPKEYRVFISFIVECQANAELGLHLYKYDDSAASSPLVKTFNRQVNSLVGGRDVAFFELSIPVELDQNDYIFFKISNETNTQNITVELSSSYRVEER